MYIEVLNIILGYDLSKQEGFDQMISDLNNEIGFKFLMAMHLNDSKGKCKFDLQMILTNVS